MTTAPRLLTAEDLLAMPDDGKRYELVRGELIEMPPPGVAHGIVVDNIGWPIGAFIRRNNLDFVRTAEVGIYVEQNPDTVHAADFAIIARERITEPVPERGYVYGLVPDLVVEVVSAGYSVADAEARAQMWLEAGVRLVLTAYIATREIVASYEGGGTRRFGSNDTLACEPVLPGFACPVADIFTY